MSQTKQATTVHGEVEYEVVECDSCGETVAKDDAHDFVVGDMTEKEHWSHRSTYEVEFSDSTYKQGHICPYCMDEGPLSTPKAKASDWLTADRALALFAILVAIAVVMTMLAQVLL